MSFVSRLFQDAASAPSAEPAAVAVDPKPLVDLFERELNGGGALAAPPVDLVQARVADLLRDLGRAPHPDDGTWLASIPDDERGFVIAAVEVCRSHFLFPRLKSLSTDVVSSALRECSAETAAESVISVLLGALGVDVKETL